MKEQAIKYFKAFRKIFCEDHLKYCPKDSIAYQATLKEKEFYDMAIKAIEQEMCEDAISRKQAIKTIEKYCSPECVQVCVLKELPPVIPPKGVTVTDFADKCRECGREKVLDRIRAEINDIAFDWREIDGEHESFKVVDLNDVLNIIDKHKAEMESK